MTSHTHASLIALALAIVLPAIDAEAAVRQVWAVNDGEKVEQNARNHPASRGNSAWDGHVVHDSTPVLADLVGHGKLTIVGAVYSLDTGKVTWLSQAGAPAAAPKLQARYEGVTPAGCRRAIAE